MHWASLVAQMVKNLPAMQGSTPSLGRSPKKGMATHSSILVWKIIWTDKPGGLQFMVSQRVDMTEQLTQQHSNICGSTHIPSRCSFSIDEQYCIVWMYHSLLVLSPSEGHLKLISSFGIYE